MSNGTVSVSGEVFALMKRYKDAYRSARLIVTFGNAIKIIGIILAVIIMLSGLIAAGQTSVSIAFDAAVVAVGYGLGFYLAVC
jgi:hypothetical protein